MVWIVLVPVLALAIYWKKSGIELFEIFPIGLMGALAGALVAVFAGLIFYHSGKTYKIDYRAPLISIADGQGVKGRFFLGSGTVNNTQSFTWYQPAGDSSYVRRAADGDRSVVHYIKPNVRPYYTYQAAHGNASWLRPFGFDFSTQAWDDEYQYDFYIPEGSISSDYALDNK